VRLGILGPLLVIDDEDRHVPVTAARLRVLLAALLLRANSPVPADALAELVWDGAPPDAAAITLRTYVRRLRVGLGPAWAERILTRPPGYLCLADEDEVDVLRFEALCRRTDTAVRERQWAQAAQDAEIAVTLWRGTPLLDVPCRMLSDEFTPRLEQLRTQVLENQAEAALALGRHEQWVQPLRELVTAHPLRERFHAQLVQALAHCGRQAEALAAYQDARRLLVAELGIEPGPELRRLHERILAGDSDTATPRTSAEPAPEAEPAAAVPRQLPAAAAHFTGRLGELDLITGLLGSSQRTDIPGGTMVISAIAGMAGIGKTALAVQAAHRLADRFPDGQLFIDLHGYTQGRPPRTADEALDWLLRALGATPRQIPQDVEHAAALYRQQLADTRTLIVLDNALNEAQVRPLLPGTGSCLVLVTSRRSLKALDDAHTVALDLLSPPDALALLCAVAGPGRIPPEDPRAGEIAELCGYLPLALRIAASLLRHRPAWTLEQLAAQLRDQHRRVTALSDGERELAAVFDLSYRSLGEQHRRLWRRLGLIPGPDLDAYSAAALTQVTLTAAAEVLEDLVDHNLLTAYAQGRYRLHDLLRVHARVLAEPDPAPERIGALNRLLHYYAHTAQHASVPLARYPRPLPDDPAPAHSPVLTEPEAAQIWLRTEQPNLDAAFTHAHTHGLDEHSVALAEGLAVIMQADGPWPRALEIHEAAAETAERLGQPAAHAAALTDLGRVRRLTGDGTGAAEVLTRTLEIHRATGNRLGEADALNDLGRVRYLTGDYPGSGHALSHAFEIFHALGNRLGEANALSDLARVRYMTGDYPGAADALTRALEIIRATGNHVGEANALNDLGRVRYLTGDYPGAGQALAQALEINRTLGNRPGEADVLTELGRVAQSTGDYPAADDALTRALEIYRALGHRGNEAWALNYYAATLAATGRSPRALEVYEQALEMNRELNKPDDEALSLEGIAEHHLANDDHVQGTAYLNQALEIYQRLGMTPDTRRVQDRIKSLA
jgi:DNA-binding SARP family transcriptional activator/tetratricopeptide (TPR) repeat protein